MFSRTLLANFEAVRHDPDRAVRLGTLRAKVEGLYQDAQSSLSASEALKIADRALSVIDAMRPDDLGSSEARLIVLRLGQTYEQLGHLSRAEEMYLQVIEASKEANDDSNQAQALRRLGRVHGKRQEWGTAINELSDALKQFTDIDDDTGRIDTINDLGTIAYERGQLGQAHRCYTEVLNASKEADDQEMIVHAGNNLGIIASIRGDNYEAAKMFSEVIEAAEARKEWDALAGAYQNLGMTHASAGSWDDANDAYDQAWQIAMDKSLMALIGTISLSRGLAALEMGRDAAAASYASKALETFESQGDQLGAAESYRVFGGIFAARGEWDTAEQFFGHSLSVTDGLENPLGSAETLRAWAIVYDKAGQAGRALAKNCEAQTLFAELGAEIERQETVNDIGRLKAQTADEISF